MKSLMQSLMLKPSMPYGLCGLGVLVLLGAGVLGSCKSSLVGEDDPGVIYSEDFDPDSVVAVLELVEGNVELFSKGKAGGKISMC